MEICSKTIVELKGMKFFIPSYQRGYRWENQEVTALLDDILEFSTESDRQYCLQPLIVKRKNNDFYEVVDGQQRLTTIYIFMKIASQEIRSATPPFEIEYETRENSKKFLQSLSDDYDTSSADSNIDFFHMKNAYDTINQWLEKQPDKSVAIQQLNTKIRMSVFFVWYEINAEANAIELFSKVNLGKIPLTNAELIKALLLNKDNFKTEDYYKKQLEVSLAWDRIEHTLQDDSFWYFLNEAESSSTRIDIIFDMLSNAGIQNDTNTNHYSSFLYFSDKLKKSENKEKYVKELWDQVEQLFADFKSWYDNLQMYHIIGYLISIGVQLKTIYDIAKDKKKSEAIRSLLHLIEKHVGHIDEKSIRNLAYGSRNNKRIRNILLLFNIATLVLKSEKQYRFPFDIYKGETANGQKWDIEHIHATADESDEPDDSVWNLTLLERSLNRTRQYASEPFDVKRKLILEKESRGLFVPLCTKNIFLKVYSSNIVEMQMWNDSDKKDYEKCLIDTISTFLKGDFSS